MNPKFITIKLNITHCSRIEFFFFALKVNTLHVAANWFVIVGLILFVNFVSIATAQ